MSVTLTNYKLGFLTGFKLVVEWHGCRFTTTGEFIELIEDLGWLIKQLHMEKL